MTQGQIIQGNNGRALISILESGEEIHSLASQKNYPYIFLMYQINAWNCLFIAPIDCFFERGQTEGKAHYKVETGIIMD